MTCTGCGLGKPVAVVGRTGVTEGAETAGVCANVERRGVGGGVNALGSGGKGGVGAGGAAGLASWAEAKTLVSNIPNIIQ
jgi:hypothetical protein